MTKWLAALNLIAACCIAHAQPVASPNADGDLCRSTTNPDLAIKHCTAAIDTGKATGDMLAQWHARRGAWWAEKGDYERAIADLDVSVKLKPDNPVVFHARGIELSVKGDHARAIADFDKALQLDPKANGARFARGRTLFYMSEFARAAGDIETAFNLQPNIYTALWLYLARRRGGNEDADDLLERETRRIRAGWPAPVIALYMGRTDANSVAVSATTTDPVRARELKCEADFYIAHAHLIKGERPRAQALLQGVQRDCPKNLLEYEGTIAELRRLQ